MPFELPPPSSPLLTTLRGLSLIAHMRGDEAELRVLSKAAALADHHKVRTDKELGPLVERTAPDGSTEDEGLTRLRHLFDAGGWVLLESVIADLPADLRWLFEAEAVTLDQLATLHALTGATAVADFADLVRQSGLRSLPGFTAETEAAVAQVLPRLRLARRRIPLGRATAVAEGILGPLRAHPAVRWAEPGGSLRRAQDTVGDIEIIAATDKPQDVLSDLLSHLDIARFLHRGPRRMYLLTDGTQVGIRCPDPAKAGAELLVQTGSHAHLDALHSRATRRGWSLGPDGLSRPDRDQPVGETEEDIYEALELQWVPPEIRDGDGEVRAAETSTLPTLLSRAAIRGDLHMHTVYSDGRDSVEAMVRACVALGYEYMAITDHSPRSLAAASLSLDAIGKQADDIAAARARYPQIAILHGCEVDILPDGRLDFSDRVLERFDIVLASLHDRAGHGPEQLLERYYAAMRHPLVSLITHPTNRVIPSRPGYEIDYDRLFAVAVETGTMIEIDGGPTHLDLDGALARRAVAAGAMLAVDSDSHRADMLDRQMEFGVKTARRGWVEARHVMNTRSLAAIRTLIAGKRSR